MQHGAGKTHSEGDVHWRWLGGSITFVGRGVHQQCLDAAPMQYAGNKTSLKPSIFSPPRPHLYLETSPTHLPAPTCRRAVIRVMGIPPVYSPPPPPPPRPPRPPPKPSPKMPPPVAPPQPSAVTASVSNDVSTTAVPSGQPAASNSSDSSSQVTRGGGPWFTVMCVPKGVREVKML